MIDQLRALVTQAQEELAKIDNTDQLDAAHAYLGKRAS